MSNTSTVTAQVNNAIASAHHNINAAAQVAPDDERQLREMAADIQAKIEDLTTAQDHLSRFLSKNCNKKPVYS